MIVPRVQTLPVRTTTIPSFIENRIVPHQTHPYYHRTNEIPSLTPKVHSESRLPSYVRNRKRKQYFKWNRR